MHIDLMIMGLTALGVSLAGYKMSMKYPFEMKWQIIMASGQILGVITLFAIYLRFS